MLQWWKTGGRPLKPMALQLFTSAEEMVQNPSFESTPCYNIGENSLSQADPSCNKVFYHLIPAYTSYQSLCCLLLISSSGALSRVFSLLLPLCFFLGCSLFIGSQPLNSTSHSCTLSTSANPPPLKPAHSCILSMLINPASFSLRDLCSALGPSLQDRH